MSDQKGLGLLRPLGDKQADNHGQRHANWLSESGGQLDLPGSVYGVKSIPCEVLVPTFASTLATSIARNFGIATFAT
jgi:hypothetical protein